jgi:superfamily II DNA or RNA helicase/HKD family nuclease
MELGVYEQIINQLFRNKLNSIDRNKFYIGESIIKKKDVADYLSRYMFQLISEIFHSFDSNDDSIRICTGLVNDIIKKIAKEFSLENYCDNIVEAEISLLSAIVDKTKCEYPDIADYISKITPTTTLSRSHLFTGHNQGIALNSELKKEILSSDDICILVSFIKVSGLNLLEDVLKQYVAKGNKLRIITTTYMQATDFNAVLRLSNLPNTEVKISYNSDSDRLHAKSFLFLRKTGFHTAYIGSSNISYQALTEGLEWNIKITQTELPDIISTIRNSFETYWMDDGSFERFRPGLDDERLRMALSRDNNQEAILDYSILDLIKAKEYQQEILEKLDVERKMHNHYRNLVVAATGTGKTVIAAFDFKRFHETRPDATFLFVVHREEIIKQACFTFRQVLGDPNFGDMWYGSVEPSSYKCLFASKDMLNNRLDSLALREDYYDYIIVDEAHHIVADSYQKIINHFKPKILLGLTATPERTDEKDIMQYFDGHISAEIRLDTALNNGLLSPFHYYGITDDVDLTQVRWERGRFIPSELSKVYTANDNRTGIIFHAMEKYLPDYNDVQALCFCVDQQHANYMNSKFILANLRSAVLTSDNGYERERILRNFKDKKINYLFVVDMFNEGVDIPNIDTVMFLRPTESVTIFLQQFGRGLRKVKGKDHLSVLDFVGHSRMEFNYIDRFRSLIGKTSMSVKEEIEHDFPHLPLGCQITLEKKAREEILNNINKFISSFGSTKILSAIKNFSRNYELPLTLANFIKLTHVPIEKIYKINSWTTLCKFADVRTNESKFSQELKRAVFKKWLSVDSYSYFAFIRVLAEKRFNINYDQMGVIDQKRSLMFYYDLFQDAGRYPNMQAMFDDLSSDEVLIEELSELMPVLMGKCEALEMEDNSVLCSIMSLKLHGTYTKDEIFVALGTSTLAKKSSCREGVERCHDLNVEAMYVDIIKDREVGSSTNYNDFAQSREFFNWESQSTVSPTSRTGLNYINSVNTMLLFVRQQADQPDDYSRTMGYTYLGEVNLVQWSGARPMQILWRLKTKMPASVFSYAGKYVAVG